MQRFLIYISLLAIVEQPSAGEAEVAVKSKAKLKLLKVFVYALFLKFILVHHLLFNK